MEPYATCRVFIAVGRAVVEDRVVGALAVGRIARQVQLVVAGLLVG